MAVEKKYSEQMPFVGTRAMKDHLDKEAARRRTSIARIVRDMLDERYLLHDGDELSLAEQAALAERIAVRARTRADDLAAQAAAQPAEEGGVTTA